MRNYKRTVKHKFIYGASLVALFLLVLGIQILIGPSYDAMVPKTVVPVTYVPEKELKLKDIKSVENLNINSINPQVLRLALRSYNRARDAGFGSKDLLTIVDYTLPSTERRMWVIDMQKRKLLYHTYVSHGKGSGDNYARRFSNQHGSQMSSLGLFVTADLYNGHYGKSLNLHGLDGAFNSNALARRIVVHPADYVSEGAIRQLGRLGRSFGCLALNPKIALEIMHVIKGGSLIFCYYPDKSWLSKSKFVA